jgi:antirestriction protein
LTAKPLFSPNGRLPGYQPSNCSYIERQTMIKTSTCAAVYVGTYAKYNQGSIEGAWLNLEEYSDKETFLAACHELHGDEEDPELMFQDWENIPEGMISESYIDSEVFAWLDLDSDERELLPMFCLNVDANGSMDAAREAYCGTFDSKEDYAEQMFTDCYNVPQKLERYIDWSLVARDLEYDGYTFVASNGGYAVFHI